MRDSKESAAILRILLLAATALSSPDSFPDETKSDHLMDDVSNTYSDFKEGGSWLSHKN